MGYSKEIIEAANRAMEQRRRQSITKAEQRRRSFFSRYPRALEIERELSRTAQKRFSPALMPGWSWNGSRKATKPYSRSLPLF